MASSTWALSQLSQLLPLDEDSLKQVLDYTSSLPKDAAAEHLKTFLGDSPRALEFISSFNSRREAATTSASVSSTPPEVPRSNRKAKKPPLNRLPAPRKVEGSGDVTGAYRKKDEEDYMSSRRTGRQEPALSNTLALSEKPEARQLPKTTSTSSKPPPSASGPLVSDVPNVRSGSRTASRTPAPAPKTKIQVSGGASMHGASTTLQDLDSAIRALELQTNPSLTASSSASRACNCMSTRHPLLAAAPNCMNCGKIICVREGLGPCTFCGHALLPPDEIQAMIEMLKQERGQERMNSNNASHRRADVTTSTTGHRMFANPRAASTTSPANATSLTDQTAADRTLDLAKQHRDRLLAFQSQNARRTQVHDEAADYESPAQGQSMWSSPVERAAQLKRQQKVLREQEWNAKPEWEKRKVVLSVDLVGGKVVKRMGAVERKEDSGNDEVIETEDNVRGGGGEKGAFSKNPLMGSLIRPVWKGKENVGGHGDAGGAKVEDEDDGHRPRASMWRRVQDDEDDNEGWILDGGVYGDRGEDGGRTR